MRNKTEYVKPTVKVVELNSNVALLQSSATLQGYQYEDDGWTDN